MRLSLVTTSTIVIALAAALPAAAQKKIDLKDPSTVIRITQTAFQPLHAGGKVLVIDVRDKVAFEGGRIPGAISVPLPEVEKRVEEIRAKAAGRQIVAYCTCPSEHSAAEALLILYKHGLTDVRALAGGLAEWMRAGGKLER